MVTYLRDVRWTTCWKAAAIATFAVVTMTMVETADAITVNSASKGYGVQVDLEVANLVGIDLVHPDALGQVSKGHAPGPYNKSASAVSVSADASANIDVNIIGIALTDVELQLAGVDGIANSTATSSVDGSPGHHSTSASGSVNDLVLNIGKANAGVLMFPDLLNLDFMKIEANTLKSTASVSGDHGSLSRSGSTIIQDLKISIAGLELDIPAALATMSILADVDSMGKITVPENTTLIDINGIAGLNLTLNEVIRTGDGKSEAGIEVNALHLSFDGVSLGISGLDVVNGDVILGHSKAESEAIPEPTGFVLVATSVGALLLRRRRIVDSDDM